MKALLDLLEGIVKREVSQLSSVLRGFMQEIQSTCGQSNNESLHVDKEVDPSMVSGENEVVPLGEKELDALVVSIENEVAPSSEKKVVGSVL
ncbi:hypothetical protein LWI29_008961 [Acer saccharum]|uniref:Uncharacterized protein n=1 Tax=Acer saccharum TaxID=4024 RepID=A0AA39W897_ACESA|nr:hypothetical protein LWI29_008961 [Acer saccharum]